MAIRTWRLEDAKNRFSELVRRALAQGPQRVTRRGRDAVIVLSAEDYQRLVAPRDLVDFLRKSPFAEALRDGAIQLERSRDVGREIAV
jgi:prevent-host-death family protein